MKTFLHFLEICNHFLTFFMNNYYSYELATILHSILINQIVFGIIRNSWRIIEKR